MEQEPVDGTQVEINGLEITVKGIVVPNDPNDPRYWAFWNEVVNLFPEG